MRDVLPNGFVAEGTIQQVNAVRKTFGYEPLFVEDGVHYNSSSKGVVRIDTMEDTHIKNAIRKLWGAKISKLNTSVSNAEFFSQIQAMPRDVTIQGLVNELLRRVSR